MSNIELIHSTAFTINDYFQMRLHTRGRITISGDVAKFGLERHVASEHIYLVAQPHACLHRNMPNNSPRLDLSAANDFSYCLFHIPFENDLC